MPRIPRNLHLLNLLRRQLQHRRNRILRSVPYRRLHSPLRPVKDSTATPPMTLSTAAKISLGAAVTVGVAAALYHTSTRATIYPSVASTLADQKRERRLSTNSMNEAVLSPANKESEHVKKEKEDPDKEDDSQWNSFTERLASLKDSVVSAVPSIPSVPLPSIEAPSLPNWSIGMPEWITILQKELDMQPGSLSREIYDEMRDPRVNPEVQWDASVRVGTDLCDEEKQFLQKRRDHTRRALAKFLDIPLSEVHEDDVPVIATTGSGGGLRAMVAGAGYYQSLKEFGLFDCTTYTAGVSGSCWLQSLYCSSLGNQDFQKVIDHIKSRINVHLAYPPAALDLLNTAPTNKYLLRGVVEKLKLGHSSYSLVDLYGLLLASRLLVPSDPEAKLNEDDLKLSQQKRIINDGSEPLPIYTAVRHEIPTVGAINEENKTIDEEEKSKAIEEDVKTDESWFQWFEMTPYEVYSEDMEAGIPTWGLGRKYRSGRNVTKEIPELKLPLLFGIFGSAFCASLSHYYTEIRPFITSISWLATLDAMVLERESALRVIHPFDPATIPNFVKGMKDQLPETCPKSLYDSEDIQLMDAGMSNNLACYPLMRKGRNVDIVIAFDSSADIQTSNWLKFTEGYAKQRKISGWPISMGWPQGDTKTDVKELQNAQQKDLEAAEEELKCAQRADPEPVVKAPPNNDVTNVDNPGEQGPGQVRVIRILEKEEVLARERSKKYALGPLSIWVGTKEVRTSDGEPPPDLEQPAGDNQDPDWHLTRPDAGIVVAYLPLIPHPKVPDVDPETCDFLSTWNFEWTSEEVDKTVGLARANFDEGKEKLKRMVRAVYERKKKERQERERRERERRMGWHRAEGRGDQFS